MLGGVHRCALGVSVRRLPRHLVAAGWYPLLNAEQARLAFATPWKWAFDVVVAAMCLIAVPVALAPRPAWGQHLPRRLIYTLACVGSTLLVLEPGRVWCKWRI